MNSGNKAITQTERKTNEKQTGKNNRNKLKITVILKYYVMLKQYYWMSADDINAILSAVCTNYLQYLGFRYAVSAMF